MRTLIKLGIVILVFTIFFALLPKYAKGASSDRRLRVRILAFYERIVKWNEEGRKIEEEFREIACLSGVGTLCPPPSASPQGKATNPYLYKDGTVKESAEYKVLITYYNPVESQTDNDPCTSASNRNICKIASGGGRVIALSRDLVSHRSRHTPFHYGDYILLNSDGHPDCNGIYRVEDTMAARFYSRADIFDPDFTLNFGVCRGTVRKF